MKLALGAHEILEPGRHAWRKEANFQFVEQPLLVVGGPRLNLAFHDQKG